MKQYKTLFSIKIATKFELKLQSEKCKGYMYIVQREHTTDCIKEFIH